MKTESLDKLFESFRRIRIAVIGDIMLDRYIFGHISRISPEYPVPVVDVTGETARLGGAANVAVNIRSAGAEALLIGVTGNDANSISLRELLDSQGLTAEHLYSDPLRPTTCKTRILSQNHHITRVDYEKRDHIPAEAEAFILERLAGLAGSLDAIVLQDYNKGVLTPPLIRTIIEKASTQGVPVLVDPKQESFFSYSGCTVFKPNLAEVARALGTALENNDRDIEAACLKLREKLDCEHLVLTRSEKGLTICNDRFTHIPATSLDVADVSGAGDTVIGVLALGIAAGLDIETSSRIANLAAATVCQEVGAAPVDRNRLYASCRDHLR
ncbi:D-glycero-beta-D-manno-heptose-7-phosphate kinase [Prosthecochloris sp. GSB1]|uniref:D-glycero-beta-D-manno-heptose-7-phosphate kinase n=1 Tax=Prosthecochloris sp. GSB1 TaxID=281093 RepID=UPI000B8C9DDB|nr:D-glycero-beta-D-manno-heptose-7-phosphate kinase [Prosthecochloris sp. GSB1]ASQ90586.1 D-glycero-beta-D-manno-heptose-7-phosphate kinase [Prosthecochloris sp. GSB1]